MNDSFFGEVDTAHLSLPYSADEFIVSSAHLVRLVEQCHYRLYGDMILFGIRACQTSSPKGQWLTEIKIAEVPLDYQHMKCLLGIWDRKNHKLSIFQGSTVPFIQNVLKQQENPNARMCNQLSQGVYQYFVGAHEPDDRPKEEGAFRLTRSIPSAVWRNYGNNTIVLDSCVPNDHIHAAASEGQDYKSAGCQVVSGFHSDGLPTGQYQQFRILAGQSAMPSALEIYLPYQYILTHTRHLKSIQQGNYVERLMHGSEGAEVRRLQESLIDEGFLFEPKIDKGRMDGRCVKAVYERQKTMGYYPDGIHSVE